jgi:hypothetical protein
MIHTGILTSTDIGMAKRGIGGLKTADTCLWLSSKGCQSPKGVSQQFLTMVECSRKHISGLSLESAIGRLLSGGVAFLLTVCVENPDCGIATSPRIEYDLDRIRWNPLQNSPGSTARWRW